MALTVLFVSGPRRSGKSAVIQQFCGAAGAPSAPHYIRITNVKGDKRQPLDARAPAKDCGVATAQWVNYDEDHVFEFLPVALRRIYHQDRHAVVIIEADADPLLRHAYPYDCRVFVMPAPHRPSEIFRTSFQAATAFKAVLDDTAAFAGEIYGLVEDDDKFDVGGTEQRSTITANELRGLINSPLGDELATRILLQPCYHGLIESDIVVVNKAIGGTSHVVDDCVRRLEKVLTHVRGQDETRRTLFCCDPQDPRDPLRDKLIRRVLNLLSTNGHTEDDPEAPV